MPPPLGAGGIMFSGCPSVRPKPEIPSFDLYMGPLVHPTNLNRFTACPSVRPKWCIEEVPYMIYFTIWEKGKEELSPLQYHFKSLHIISRHYKKSLLRSQIYHGYEELSTDTNYPIWRRQKLPYMKKTRKKKQVCGAACFMAAEIKFSEDVRPSVCPSVRLSVRPSGEVSGHLPENAWREWPQILHADLSWPPSELISLWPRSVDFSNFGAILT